jgi:hypothetical protein
MSNTFVNPTMVAREALRQLENNCVMGRLSYRGYEEEWKKNPNGYKIGSSVTVKAPVYFRVQDGADITSTVVDLLERSTTFTIAYRKHVAWKVSAQEMTLNIDKFSKRFIKPAMQALGNYIDETMLGLYKDVPAQVGTIDTTPSSLYTYLEAGATLDDMACPKDNRHCVVDPWAQAKMADHLKGLFHNNMVGQAVKKGKFGDIAGFNMYMSQNVNTHTCGTAAGASGIAVDDAGIAEGDSTIAVDHASTDYTFKEGDIFTIAGVNAVNPISGADTGTARQFVVDADVSMSGGGHDATLTCTPGTAPYVIRSAGGAAVYDPYQNVSALHADDAALTIPGSSGAQYKVNLAFHKHAFGLSMVPLEMPASVGWKAQESYKGYSIRVIRDYDVLTDNEYIRFDVLFGIKTLNPLLACRIAGQ